GRKSPESHRKSGRAGTLGAWGASVAGKVSVNEAPSEGARWRHRTLSPRGGDSARAPYMVNDSPACFLGTETCSLGTKGAFARKPVTEPGFSIEEAADRSLQSLAGAFRRQALLAAQARPSLKTEQQV